ncbi:putative vacuolar protein sorting-associated protein 62 [Tanacetum coccineum]
MKNFSLHLFIGFFENGAKLYQLGKDPSPVFKNDENLLNNGSVEDEYLDLPSDESEKDRVKKGSLPDASAYIHVKSTLGGTFTDLAIWLYYPFNGGAKFQLGPFTIPLGKLGEHVGAWVDASEFEFINGTRPVVYASLHGHSHYKAPNKNTHWAGELDSSDKQMLMDAFTTTYPRKSFFHWGFGLRDDTDKGGNVMDIAAKSYQVSATYWLDYTGRWGPKVSYDPTAEVMSAVQNLPRLVRKLALKVLNKLPDELYGEEGPEGPKMKSSWDGDEKQ